MSPGIVYSVDRSQGALSWKYKTAEDDETPFVPCSKQQPLSCTEARIVTVEKGLTCRGKRELPRIARMNENMAVV